MRDLHEDSLWDAVRKRDASYGGVFYFGVKTTGVYCRPGCPSPIPRRENVVFSFSPSSLVSAGYRPCRRCHPDGSSTADASVAAVVDLCRYIEESETVPAVAELASRAGLSASTVNRRFKQALGVTPREYADAHRRERFRSSLRAGAGVLDAALDAGYGSTSRVYEGASRNLGMTPGQYRNGGQGQSLGYSLTETPLGWLLVAATAQGISAVKLGDDSAALVCELRTEFPKAVLGEGDDSLRAWTAVLVDYLSGRLPWPELPYDVRATAFQRRVWQFLRSIPAGSTMHYSEVAAALGRPTATRAVARACATNPVALVVPCHRVVPRGPGFAGFRWGIERKRRLLELEGSPEAKR